MSSLAFLLVIIAAVTHAGWNVAAKQAGGTTVFACMSSFLSAALWAPILAGCILYLPEASPRLWTLQQWGFIALSAAVHAAYFTVLLRGYRAAPLSVVYPIARGSGPLIS